MAAAVTGASDSQTHRYQYPILNDLIDSADCEVEEGSSDNIDNHKHDHGAKHRHTDVQHEHCELIKKTVQLFHIYHPFRNTA